MVSKETHKEKKPGSLPSNFTKDNLKPSQETTGCIRQRFVLCGMGFLALASAYTMRACLSVAITAMVLAPPFNNFSANHSVTTWMGKESVYCPAPSSNSKPTPEMNSIEEFEWDEETQGLVLSSFFWGYLVTHLPAGLLSEKFGGKHALGLGILSTTVMTLITPIVTRRGGANWLIVVRVIAGLAEGFTFPSLNALMSHWVPANERGLLGTFVYSGPLMGTIIGTSVCGALIQVTQTWECGFYVFGGLGIIWFAMWQTFCFNTPETNPYISETEKKYLDRTIGKKDENKKKLPVPWKKMLFSLPLWALFFANLGHDWIYFIMVSDLPKYMKDVLKFSISEIGILSALPYVGMWFVSIFSGRLTDKLIKRGMITITNARKLLTAIGSVGPSVGIIAASYAGCSRTAAVILFTTAMAFMGTSYPGTKINSLDLSPNFAGTIMAIINGSGAVTGIIGPYLIGVLTPDITVQQWRLVFWITTAIGVVSRILFMFGASGEVQPWNNPSDPADDIEKKSKKDSSVDKDEPVTLISFVYLEGV